MKYLIFNTESEAQVRNHEICVSQGSGKPGDITQYWFSTIMNNLECALVVDDESLLTDIERENLKDEQWMTNNGWTI